MAQCYVHSIRFPGNHKLSSVLTEDFSFQKTVLCRLLKLILEVKNIQHSLTRKGKRNSMTKWGHQANVRSFETSAQLGWVKLIIHKCTWMNEWMNLLWMSKSNPTFLWNRDTVIEWWEMTYLINGREDQKEDTLAIHLQQLDSFICSKTLQHSMKQLYFNEYYSK